MPPVTYCYTSGNDYNYKLTNKIFIYLSKSWLFIEEFIILSILWLIELSCKELHWNEMHDCGRDLDFQARNHEVFSAGEFS